MLQVVAILSFRAYFHSTKRCYIECLGSVFYCINGSSIDRSIVRETGFVCFSVLCSVYCRNIVNVFTRNTVVGISVLAAFYTGNLLSVSIDDVFCYVVVCPCSYLLITDIVYAKYVSLSFCVL